MLGGIIRGLLGLAMLAVSGGTAIPCVMAARFEITDIRTADLVVRGEVVEFSKVGFGEERPLEHYGLIRLKVIETWKGEEREEWELYWWNSTFGIPEDWQFGAEVVIAAIDPSRPQPPLRGPSATVRGTVRPDLHQVLQAPCASPFVFRTSPREDEVAAWRRETDGLRRMMDQLPSERMRQRLERMMAADPAKTYRRRIAALRACVDEDEETCKAVWRGQ